MITISFKLVCHFNTMLAGAGRSGCKCYLPTSNLNMSHFTALFFLCRDPEITDPSVGVPFHFMSLEHCIVFPQLWRDQLLVCYWTKINISLDVLVDTLHKLMFHINAKLLCNLLAGMYNVYYVSFYIFTVVWWVTWRRVFCSVQHFKWGSTSEKHVSHNNSGCHIFHCTHTGQSIK